MEGSDMPETAQYRIDVTKWCNYVIATTKANPTDPEAVEDAVNMGQVEELIEMAEDEMVAMDTYLKTRMWELVSDNIGNISNEDGNDDGDDNARQRYLQPDSSVRHRPPLERRGTKIRQHVFQGFAVLPDQSRRYLRHFNSLVL